MPKPAQNLHPEDIKAAIRKTGITISRLGKLHGLCGSTTIHAIHRPQPSGNHVIAKWLKKPVYDIWPEWFNKDGTRKKTPSVNKSKLAQCKTKCHRQKEIAA